MTESASTLAAFTSGLSSEAVGGDAREAITCAWVDTIGVLLAGSASPVGEAVGIYLRETGVQGPARVPGIAGVVTGAELAALATGTMAHALDFDDVAFRSWAHASAVLVPVLLALGDVLDASGEDALTAYAAGFEVEARVGAVAAAAQYAAGWHTTGTLGALGAAAAAASLLDLDWEQTRNALALAASTSSGLQANFGSTGKPLHAGLAARNGILAATLAAAGATGAPEAIEGFLETLGGDAGAGLEERGGVEITRSDFAFKLYPCCAAAHRAIDACLSIRGDHGVVPEQVERVVCLLSKRAIGPLPHHRPQTSLQAKASMEYCAAVALLDGRVGLSQFADERVTREDVQRLLTRIDVRAHGGQDADVDLRSEFSEVEIVLAGGTVLRRRVDEPRGFPASPPTEKELEAKFLECAAAAMAETSAAELLSLLTDPAAVPVRRVVSALTSSEALSR